MQQFDLSIWLQDKSRKVVTRDGKSVRIVCWDLKCNTPIIAAIQWNQEREDCYCYNTKGRCANNVGELDLFFADEEELTEFEKTMIQFSHERNSLIQFEHTTEEINAHLYLYSEKLLDLARKELTKNLPQKNDSIFELLEIFGEWLGKNGYSFKFPKSDTLKDLPKWKDVSGKNGAGTKDYKIVGYYLVKGNYAIYLEDLDKLPKE